MKEKRAIVVMNQDGHYAWREPGNILVGDLQLMDSEGAPTPEGDINHNPAKALVGLAKLMGLITGESDPADQPGLFH
jgi:hypothetical protein